MDKSMNTTKALGVLNLKPKNIYSLIEAEKFDDVSIGTLTILNFSRYRLTNAHRWRFKK